ncbi:MAG TPA: NAD(P)-dependent methylenetetrahydromethanopterin dehydrogenase [Vicinamibacterales bacterium]|nr:NAD(P)-dependent methylenetetrahydromethanopterin dehydrogenase [Vicinamibacterales bacterium]
MKKLLLQFDSSAHPSAFDQVVAYDGGADRILTYSNVKEADVRDLVHGAIFTRGPKDLHNTAIFIGGTDMPAGETLLAAAKKTVFGPMRVSMMLDSNGSNTTAVAAVAKLRQTAGDVAGKRAVITAGTGPVGMRAAGLLAMAGAKVVITSRKAIDAAALDALKQRFTGDIRQVTMAGASQAASVLDGAEILLNCGPAGVMLVPKSAWTGRKGLIAAADLNAVPPLGIEGIDVMDNGVDREGVTCFGALGVGGLKMKIHKACIAKLFERNDLVLDAETIADVARELTAQ